MYSVARRPRHLAHLTFVVLALVFSSLAVFAPQRVAAQQAERCFPETGFCIGGTIRSYWERNGGLAVFGYPISAQRLEFVEGWRGPVQWFERDRLEDHSAAGQGVLAGRLGARSLELQGINWQTLPSDSGAQTGCRFFRETQFNLCEPFLSYWQNNGGLERFGYPLTRQRAETIEGREFTVQYFERRRMELHPANGGTGNTVLLGLLGRDVYAVEGEDAVINVPAGDLSADIQQPVLDAAYATLRASYPRLKLAVGLVDVTGDSAVAMAKRFGQPMLYLNLVRRAGVWQTDTVTTTPPNTASSDKATVVRLALEQLQDPRGDGMNSYVTRPRVSGAFARLWFAPAISENIDPASAFFKREGGSWRFLTAGTAYPEEQLREMGVPEELWSAGELVHGPQG